MIDLKSSILPVTTLLMDTADLSRIKKTILNKKEQAPDFFSGLPVLLELRALEVEPDFFPGLIEFLRRSNIIPFGIKTANDAVAEQAEVSGLAIFSRVVGTKPAPEQQENEARQQQPPQTTPVEASENDIHSAKIINGTVRGGQQVYAAKRDLLVLGSVNNGAEVIADGHVHVMGKLRGRVIAGASGFKEARIFAQAIDPELICIAGCFQLADDIKDEYKDKQIEISLQNDIIVFNPQ
jgi:septum site-determining protein MinC